MARRAAMIHKNSLPPFDLGVVMNKMFDTYKFS
jgi:hypothetical protein